MGKAPHDLPLPRMDGENGSLWDRRDFLILSGLSGVAAAMPAAAALPIHTLVADTRFAAGRAFAASAERSDRRVRRIEGDITGFWYDELDLLWRRRSVAIAGLTAYGAFFCLERLAMDRGLRAVFKQELRGPDQPLFAWAIAPKTARPA